MIYGDICFRSWISVGLLCEAHGPIPACNVVLNTANRVHLHSLDDVVALHVLVQRAKQIFNVTSVRDVLWKSECVIWF